MKRPNIVLITTDQQRFDAMSLNAPDGSAIQTPHLDELAAHGVNFTRGYVTCPSCIAARRTILTGLHPSNPRHGRPGYLDGEEFFPDFTLPGLLSGAGYQTQLIGKFHVYPQGKRYGFDNVVLSEQLDWRPDSDYFGRNDYVSWLARRGHRFSPIACGVGANSRIARPFHLADDLHHSNWCVHEAIDFLRRRRDPACPFFLHLSFWAPHPPFVPPRTYFGRYMRRAARQPAIGEWAPKFSGPQPRGQSPEAGVARLTEPELRESAAGYYGLINHVDDQVYRLLNAAFDRGTKSAAEPMLILFTSDHGEMLGDHYLHHKQVAFEGSTHVPFFVSGRDVDLRTGSCDALVGLEDLLPTVCELAGVDVPGPVDGRSLAAALRGQAPPSRPWLFGEHAARDLSNHWLIEAASYRKYVWHAATGEEMLFDLSADPRELNDLSADAAALAPFRQRMADHLAGRRDYNYDRSKLTPCAGRPPRAIYGEVR
ncbi:MAG: Arylsulfatase [Phycisphaerae bacterium]|nr:Arylsulfatase [Phycisphaerae bacterium]